MATAKLRNQQRPRQASRGTCSILCSLVIIHAALIFSPFLILMYQFLLFCVFHRRCLYHFIFGGKLKLSLPLTVTWLWWYPCWPSYRLKVYPSWIWPVFPFTTIRLLLCLCMVGTSQGNMKNSQYMIMWIGTIFHCQVLFDWRDNTWVIGIFFKKKHQ